MAKGYIEEDEIHEMIQECKHREVHGTISLCAAIGGTCDSCIKSGECPMFKEAFKHR